MPSKLENLAKRGHGIPFSLLAQMARNVGKTDMCRMLKTAACFTQKLSSEIPS